MAGDVTSIGEMSKLHLLLAEEYDSKYTWYT